MKRAKKGFTLVEVIIVLVIIAIVAIIAVPSISKYIDHSKLNNCDKAMESFLNDMEYKIVSKRYYDVRNLNDELIDLVDSKSDSYKLSDNNQGMTEAIGICPNGGHYTVNWAITSDNNNSNSAKVVVKTRCDCMEANNEHEREQTAVFVSATPYVSKGNGVSDEERKIDEIINIISVINPDIKPSKIDESTLPGESNSDTEADSDTEIEPLEIKPIIEEVNSKEEYKDKYEVLGMTVSSKGEPEWICVDFIAESSNGEHKIVVYYPGISKSFVYILSDGEYNGDKKNAIPVEGSAGSYTYCNGRFDEKTVKIADTNESYPWLQRDGSWYVEKNDFIRGIDLNKNDVSKLSAEGKDHPLISTKRLSDIEVSISPLENASKSAFANLDYRDFISVTAKYDNNSEAKFGCLETDVNTSFIKNGYVILNSAGDAAGRDWTKVSVNGYTNGAPNDTSASQNKIKSFLNSENASLVVAYQEYYKTIGADGGIHCEKVTRYKVFRNKGPAPDDQPFEITVPPDGTLNDIIITKPVIIVSVDPEDPEKESEPEKVDVPVKKPEIDVTKVTNEPIEITDENGNKIGEIKVVIPEDKDPTINSDGKSGLDPDEIEVPLEIRFYDNNGESIKDDKNEDVVIEATTKPSEVEIKPDGNIEISVPGVEEPVVIPPKKQENNQGNEQDNNQGNEQNNQGNDNENNEPAPVINYEVTSEPDTSIITDDEKTIEEIVKDIKVEKEIVYDINGEDVTVPVDVELTTEKKDDGSVIVKDKDTDNVVAKLEPVDKADYDIFFDQAVVSGDTFRVEDMTIKKRVDYLLKNANDEVIGRKSEYVEIPHASKAGNGEVGFFVSEDFNDKGYVKEEEDSSLNHINHGMGQGFIFLTDPDMTYKAIGHISTYENGGYLNWSYDKKENDNKFDINKLKATLSYKVTVASLDPENGNRTTVGEGFIGYEYSHKTDKNSYGFYLVGNDTYGQGSSLWNSDVDSELCDALNGRYAAAKVMLDYYKYNGNTQQDMTTQLCNVVNYFDNITASYTNDGKGFDFKKLTAEANYKTAIYQNDANSPAYTIDHLPVTLNHDSEEGNKLRYYMSMFSYNQDLYSIKTLELAALAQLYGDYRGETYVAYNDKNIWGNPETKKAKIFVDCTSDINPPEMVYFPISGTQNAYAVAYIGNSKNITVNSSYEGYWSETMPGSEVNSKFVKITAGNKDYYYIDDDKNYNVTRIGNVPNGNEDYQLAFPNTSGITRVDISDGVKEIGPGAFGNTNNSDKFKKNEAVISLPDSVNAIGKNAFSGLNIGNIILGNINKNVADDGSVTSASSDTSDLLSIGADAFSGTTLNLCDAFVVPKKVASIGTGAFSNFKIGDGGLFIDGVSDASENSVSKDIFNGTEFGRLSFGPEVEKIEAQAFMDNTSSAVLNLGSVKSIGGDAFSGWVNASGDLVIPESVTSIKDFAFNEYANNNSTPDNYPALTIKGGSYQTEDGTVGLGSMIFTNGHFRNISIGGNVEVIDDKAFENSPLKGTTPYNEFRGNLKVADKVSRIGENAFKNCAGFDGELTLPGGGWLRTIDKAAFSGCFKFTGGLSIPDGTETIGAEAFKDCLGFNGTLTLPNAVSEREGLLEIGDEAFSKCFGFKGSLIIPDTVKRIGNSTFEECSGFDGNIDFGNSIQVIGSKAFYNCNGFNGDLTVPETVTTMGEKAFDSYAAALTDPSEYPALTVKAGDSNDGLNLGGLIFTNGHFKNVSVGGKIAKIGDYAFNNVPGEYSNFTGQLTIGNNVTSIGKLAFKECTGFTGSLDFPKNQVLNIIGDEAFEGCTGFTGAINIPDGVQTIGIKTFEGCTGFDGSIKLSSDLKKIGAEAFRNCVNIKGGLTIPETVTGGIGAYAFENFASAVSDTDAGKLIIGSGSTGEGKTLGAFIFNGSKFKNMSIGGIVETVSEKAFKHDMTPLPSENSNGSGSGSEESQTTRTVVADYSGIKGTLFIDDSVKVIDNSAFQEMKIQGLTGMAGVQRIGRYAFWKCDKIASDITFENNTSLERIEREAFYGTTSLGSLTIPPSVTFMGPYAFDNSGSGNGRLVIFGASRIEDGKKFLGDNKYSGQPDTGGTLFNHARYRDVIIGGNVDVIGQYFMKSDFSRTDGSYDTDFDHHGITGSLTITGHVSEIEGEAFNDAGFDGTLTLNSSKLETIGYSAFENLPNMYGDITIPQTVHNIDRRAFKKFAMNAPDSKLGTLRIKGYSETNGNQHIIGYRLFSFARFKSVEIGGENSSVNTIGNFAFYNSSLATDSTLEDNQTVYEVFNSGSGYTDEDIKVYRNLKYDERNEGVKVNNDNSNYSRFTPELKILDGIETIGTRAFGDNHSILRVNLESNVLKTIGKDAFNRCTNAGGGLTIPKTVTSIGRCAFKQYGENTDNPGTLRILGYSDNVGGIKYIGIPLNNINDDPKPIFPSAKFNNVVIGGNDDEATVNAIGDKFMNNIDSSNNTYNYSGMTGSLTIGKSIKSVGREAFVLCTGFNGALTLNENLQTIGHDAFNACNNFHGDLTIPSTVTSIGSYAFKHFGQGMVTSGGNTGSLTILGYSSEKGGLKTIDKDIFNHGHYTNVTIGGNVESIADDFMNNQYTDDFGYGDVRRFDYVNGSLTIGSSVKKIGKTAFLSCDKLNGALTLNEGLKSIGENAFNDCRSFHGDLLIPSTVSSIGTQAFKHFGQDSKNTGSLTIRGYSSIKPAPDDSSKKLQTIDSLIFSHAHFRNVYIGGNVQYIGENFMENYTKETFKDTNGNNLEPVPRYNGMTGDLTIGEGVFRVGKNAFWDCNNFDGVLTIGKDVWQIGESAFSGCRGLYTRSDIDPDDRKLVISSHVTQIGSYAFKSLGESLGNERNNRFPSLEIYGASGGESNMKSIGGTDASGNNIRSIFSNARFNNVTIGGEVKIIGDDFMNNWMHSEPYTKDENAQDKNSDYLYSYIYGDLTIQDNTVDIIGDSAFAHVQFDNVYIGTGIDNIKRCAFKYAGSGNGALTIKSGTVNNTTLGDSARNNPVFICAKFNGVNIGGDVKTISAYFMKNDSHAFQTKENMPLYCYYGDITGDIVIGGSVTQIGAEAFYNMESDNNDDNRGKLILNEGLISIGASAFANTRFFGSQSLTGERREERVLTIPSTVTTIGTKAFENFCNNFGTKPRLIIKGYSQNDSNHTLGTNIFPGASFENVTIGGSVRHIDGQAFMGSEYNGITGTFTITPETVGYTGNGYESLSRPLGSTECYAAGISFGCGDMWFSGLGFVDKKDYGPFRGCKFTKVVFPKGMYDIFNGTYATGWSSSNRYYKSLFNNSINYTFTYSN
ncbi:MAG: leucine-rich repeat protein [Oscillospiraceae bacterium]|nr:leucine-rich repeat protein [Oscillospiraceae bacterium]